MRRNSTNCTWQIFTATCTVDLNYNRTHCIPGKIRDLFLSISCFANVKSIFISVNRVQTEEDNHLSRSLNLNSSVTKISN